MPKWINRLVSVALLLALGTAAHAAAWIELTAPVTHAFTFAGGRQLTCSVTAISDDALKVVRGDTRLREEIPLADLGKEDRAWFARLREAAPSDTVFVKEIRRCFLRQDPVTKKLLPLSASAYTGNRYFIVMDYWSVKSLPLRPEIPSLPAGYDTLPILWLYRDDEVELSQHGAIRMPPNHAILDPIQMRKDTRLLEKLSDSMRGDWRKMNTSSTVNVGEEEQASMDARAKTMTPVYWPEPPINAWWKDRSGAWSYRSSENTAWLMDREGRVVTYRGIPVCGELKTVRTVLFEKTDQLKLPPAPGS